MYQIVVGGLDLAAYEHKCSGFAAIDDILGVVQELVCLYKDEDIIEKVIALGVDVLAIDAPIAEYPRFREVDRKAISKGFRVMPPTFKHMRILTMRAWQIYQRLRSVGVTVIETHPSSALKSSRARDVVDLCKAFRIPIDRLTNRLKHKDLRDALISALVALCYKNRSCISSIDASDGVIYIITPIDR